MSLSSLETLLLESAGTKISGGINSQVLKVDEDVFKSWFDLACRSLIKSNYSKVKQAAGMTQW